LCREGGGRGRLAKNTQVKNMQRNALAMPLMQHRSCNTSADHATPRDALGSQELLRVRHNNSGAACRRSPPKCHGLRPPFSCPSQPQSLLSWMHVTTIPCCNLPTPYMLHLPMGVQGSKLASCPTRTGRRGVLAMRTRLRMRSSYNPATSLSIFTPTGLEQHHKNRQGSCMSTQNPVRTNHTIC